ncbi:sensor histidine kinase [Nitratireductor sp. GCM10026969]|uniref:sensor histidine kinase n=1 Tax=Nitratireductor sp. GCM10026969 TaxID=3252645 RepID=UPI003622F30A
MIDLAAELQSVAEADVIGLAIIGADRAIQRKIGRLVDWLPTRGLDCCQCMLLIGMESELVALAEGQRDIIALSGVRGASSGLDHPMTAAIVWNRHQSHYVVIAIPDFAAHQVGILFESERRARRVMEQQLEAANTEARFASLARARLRLARDLHDTLVHSMMALLTQIRVTQHFLSTDPARVSEGLAVAEEAAVNGLARARDAIARLRMPDDLEPTADIEEMLLECAERTGTEISVNIDNNARDCLRNYSVTVKRILSEALRNIETHAKARRVQFRATETETEAGRRFVVEICDDGCGFDPTVSKPGHFGLTGMMEFAELADGECTVKSAHGDGTVVRLSLPPIASSEAPASGPRKPRAVAGWSKG